MLGKDDVKIFSNTIYLAVQTKDHLQSKVNMMFHDVS